MSDENYERSVEDYAEYLAQDQYDGPDNERDLD